MQRKTNRRNPEEIRLRAEELQQKLAEKTSQSPDHQELYHDSQRLIEELSLYQTELEMQNEQLRLVTEELANSVNRYEDLYDFAPVGYLTLDKYGLILEVNLTASVQLKTDRLGLLETRLSRFIAPEHFDGFVSFVTSMVESEEKQTCEITIIRPDKSLLDVRLEGIALLSRFEELVQCRVAVIDITEQKANERKWLESQAFVKKIADTIPDILTVYDLETRQNIYGNREIYSLLGISAESIRLLNQQALNELIHPDDRDMFAKNMAACRSLGDAEVNEFEYRTRNRSGHYFWLRVRSVVFQRNVSGMVSQILSVQQDITFKKEAEEELRYKTQIINGLQSNLPVVISLIKPDGEFIGSSGSGMESLKKVGITELVGQNIFTMFPELGPQIESVFRNGEKVSYQHCIGAEQEVCFQNFVYLDKTLNAAIAFSIDISAQTEAEQRIRAEQEFSQSLLDNSVDGILAFDKELRFTAWNKVMESNTGILKEAVIGKEIFELFPDFQESESGRALQRVLQGKRFVLYNQNFGFIHSDYEVYLNPLQDDANHISGGLCILHSVKARKKLEAETTQLKLDQQKAILNAVLATQEEERRRIAESLHNGVGQLLYAAKLNLERLSKEKPTNSENSALLTELLDEAIRETRTISFELTPRILEDFGLETALQELLKRISGPNLKISLHTNHLRRFSAGIEIAVYRIIQELINNIIKHAKATMAALEVTCSRNKLAITVKDNGIGFDEKSLALKTKGIGLTSIQNRVKLLNGELTIETAPSQGTEVTIEITLPK